MKQNVTDKKQRVLDTALMMILENGIQSASMGKISKASGVAVGTIYHHFSSKEELVSELYKYHKMDMVNRFQNLRVGKTLKETFYIFMKDFINYGLENPDEFEFIERFYRSPIIDDKVMQEIETAMLKDNPLVEGYFSNPELFKDISLQSILLFINGALVHTVRAYLSGEIDMTEKDWHHFIDMLWDGVSK